MDEMGITSVDHKGRKYFEPKKNHFEIEIKRYKRANLDNIDRLIEGGNNDIEEAKSVWRLLVNDLLKKTTQLIADFIDTRIESSEVRNVRKEINSKLRKTDLWQTIEVDSNLQQIFVLGHFYATNEILNTYEDIAISDEDIPVINAIKAYGWLASCILAVDAESQISHSELAERIGISASALSDSMSRVEKYDFFDSTVVGRYKYYSLSYPKGRRALALIKREHIQGGSALSKISRADTINTILIQLCDMSRRQTFTETVWENYEELVRQQDSMPETARDCFLDLAMKLTTQRVSLMTLLEKEKCATRIVEIYTTDIESVHRFSDKEIVKNWVKGLTYHIFIVTSDHPSLKRSCQEKLTELIAHSGANLDYDSLFNDEKLVVTPLTKNDWSNRSFCLGDYSKSFNELSEVVIFDQETAFLCEDDKVTSDSLYTVIKDTSDGKRPGFNITNRG